MASFPNNKFLYNKIVNDPTLCRPLAEILVEKIVENQNNQHWTMHHEQTPENKLAFHLLSEPNIRNYIIQNPKKFSKYVKNLRAHDMRSIMRRHPEISVIIFKTPELYDYIKGLEILVFEQLRLDPQVKKEIKEIIFNNPQLSKAFVDEKLLEKKYESKKNHGSTVRRRALVTGGYP